MRYPSDNATQLPVIEEIIGQAILLVDSATQSPMIKGRATPSMKAKK